MNIAMMRGTGFQLIDNEQGKIMAHMFWALTGNRNDQEIIGNGNPPSYTTGIETNDLGKANSNNASGVNKLLGLEGYIACVYEWTDNIAFNVKDWKTFKKNACVASAQDPVDYKFHIYDPISDRERVVGVPSGATGYNVARVKHGRFCDILPSKLDTTDNSRFITYYCCYATINSNAGRVVGRAGYDANASGGLAYTGAGNASSYSSTSSGSRLAFRGEIVEVDE
jgi:hypothetical protein